MKRLLLILLIIASCVSLPAQKAKPKVAAKPAAAKQTPKKPAPKKPAATAKKPAAKQPSQREKMQQQQRKLKQDIEQKKRRQAELERKVKEGLQGVMTLTSEIADKQRSIDTIRRDISSLDTKIAQLDSQLVVLHRELDDRRQRYVRSIRYMHRNRKAQNRLMFIFSAKNFNQMYRRTRFVNEYATFQKAQGEAVKQKQEQIGQKQTELKNARRQHAELLARGEQERRTLETKQVEQKKMVDALKKEQKTTEALLAQQQKQEADLNARIEQMIAEEIAREKARLEAERKRKAEELARKKAAEEQARRDHDRRIAAAKEAERKARAEARAAKSAEEKAQAQQRARQAEQQRQKAEEAKKRDEQEQKAAAKELSQQVKAAVKAESYNEPAADRKLSGNFASNKGRLPMPITGAYKVVRGFGSYVPEGLSSVRLDSKGIHIKGQPGAQARCVFDGEVSRIFAKGDRYIVMVRHGRYISVYINLTSVSVRAGQKVSARQVLGSLGSDCTLQFQLRNWTQLLNPRSWLGR
ncbi:MAG: peptidoglycan DD-metalloendopeptidase family protein [Prevotella sp.]|nr:peptidoglycan DD-metalloendopeptidase family protein [Prevotella sp.]